MSYVGTLVLVASLVAACSGAGAGEPQGINKGNRARDFTLETLDGDAVSLEDHRGSVVLINFWATWCPPCRAEIPDIQAIYDERQGDGFVVLGVNVEETRDQVEPFVGEFNITYPVLLDESGRLLKMYRATGLPMSVIVDQEGVIHARHVGYLSAAQLESYLAELLP
jgi:peroxiredoxin